MTRIFFLLKAHIKQHKFRTALTVMATACACSLIIWVVSSYGSVIESINKYSSRALGRYALVIDPVSREADRFVGQETVDFLRSREEVLAVDPMHSLKIPIKDNRYGLRSFDALFVGTDAKSPPFALSEGRWLSADDQANELQAVLRKDFAKSLGVVIGDKIEIPRTDESLVIKIIGLSEPAPTPIGGIPLGTRELPSPNIAEIFTSRKDLVAIHGKDPSITFVALELKNGVDVHAFRYAISPKLNDFRPPMQVMSDYDLEEELEEHAYRGQVGIQMWVVAAVAGALSFLVVIAGLSMGVGERIRQFALLRAIAFTKKEIGVLVVIEGLLVTGLGILLGIPLGAVLLTSLGALAGRTFHTGVSVDLFSVFIATLIAGSAALLASLTPAWRATRVKPLDAVAPSQSGGVLQKPPYWPSLVLSPPLLLVSPLLSFVWPPSSGENVIGRMLLAFGALALGLVLFTPLAIKFIDVFFTTVIARICGLRPELLSGQMSARPWRSIACALMLSIGFGLFASVQIWGNSMVETFVPGAWAPDATVVSKSTLSKELIQSLASSPNVEAYAPIVSEHPKMKEDLTGSAEHGSVTRQNSVVLVGVDPNLAFAGKSPLLGGEWVLGDPMSAIQSIKENRGCVVSDHFIRDSGLKLGDSFELIPPEDPDRPVTYVIAGAIRFDGWHWLTKLTNLRTRTHRAGALVIANAPIVKADFSLSEPRHLWLKGNLKEKDLLSVLKSNKQDDVSEKEIRVVMTSEVGDTVRNTASKWLWMMSVLPLVAMAIAALGILNVIMAGVRARRWELGILRAIGYNRWVLVRLVIAEGMLVGLVSVFLGLLFGWVAGWSGAGITCVVGWFGGLDPVLVVPKTPLIIGGIVTMFFASLAATWPALRIGKTPVLNLLQASRSDH